MEVCAGCGIDRDAISADEVVPRVIAGVATVDAILAPGTAGLNRRPAPTVWSVLEYAAHMRDVLLNQREGIIVALVEDGPVKQKMYRDERLGLGMYATETQDEIRRSLAVAGRLFAHAYNVLSPEQLDRTIVYFGIPRTLTWTGAQAVHEVEHHLGDIRAQL